MIDYPDQFTELLQNSADLINPVAEAWLATGAASFSVWAGGELQKKWQNGRAEDDLIVSAAIQIENRDWAEIRVCGIKDESGFVQIRLSTDAKMIGALLHLEHEHQQLSYEFADIRDQLVVLSTMSDAARNIINIEELLKVLVEHIYRLVKSDEVCLLLKVEGKEHVWETHPHLPSLDRDQLLQIAYQYESGSRIIPLAEGQSEFLTIFGKNLLVIPIHVYGTELALLILINPPQKGFNNNEIKLAKAIADYAGMQIEKVNIMHYSMESSRFETEIFMAQKIQQSLLIGCIPEIDGLNTFLCFEPASRISGDYYDVIIGYNNVVYFVIGDISGKGMPAALFMAMTLKAIRSAALLSTEPGPDIILNRVNEMLYKDYNGASMFSTIFIGQYDPRTKEMTYSNAGHSPVIYYPVGEKATMLWADTFPLGVFPELTCKVGKLRLAAGDILLLATDGINETSNKSNRLFGFTQLMLLVEMLAQKEVSEINSSILKAVKDYGDGKDQEDDRAMIVIKGV